MVQIGGSIFHEMLGSFNPFKILNSVGNLVEFYREELKKKDLSINTKEIETFSCRCRT